jgi:hypothetical protein
MAVASTAVVCGVISWLPTETQRSLSSLVLNLLLCYGMLALIFCAGVLAIGTAQRVAALALGVVGFCYKRFGGIHFERERRARERFKRPAVRVYSGIGPAELITLPDGTKRIQPLTQGAAGVPLSSPPASNAE